MFWTWVSRFAFWEQRQSRRACVGSNSAVLRSLNGTSATVASLSTTLAPQDHYQTERKWSKWSRGEGRKFQRSNGPSLKVWLLPDLHRYPPSPLQPTADRGPFFVEWGVLPRRPCLFEGMALEFAFVYSPDNLLGGSGYIHPEQCQPLDHLALP